MRLVEGLLFRALVVASTATLSLGATPTPAPLATRFDAPPAWSAFQNAWAAVAEYTTTITVFERKGTEIQNVAFDYTFRKPSSVTVHVVKGPNAGVTLEWSGGDTIVAHRGSGFVAMFKKTLSLHDPAATTIRGSSIDQLSFAAILAHGQNLLGSTSQEAGPEIDGIPTESVKIVPTSALGNTGLTLEIVDISSTTNMPMRVLGYDGAALVRQIDFSNVKISP